MATTIDGSNSVTINSGSVLGITSGTAQASTSGTSINFTDIPSWVKRITVMFNGVSTNGTSQFLVQLGSGSVDNTGYSGQSTTLVSAGSITSTALTSGFRAGIFTANTELNYGVFVLTLLGSNIWACMAQVSNSTYNSQTLCSGTKTLSGTLDRVRITTVNGTDTFDAGSINILYE
jgi:hypothetical protein